METAREKKMHREILTMQRRAILSDIKIPLRPSTEVGIIYKGETFHPPGGHKTKIGSMTKKVISVMILETTLDDVIVADLRSTHSSRPSPLPVQFLLFSCSCRQKLCQRGSDAIFIQFLRNLTYTLPGVPNSSF